MRLRRSVRALLIAGVAVASAIALGAASASATSNYPVQSNIVSGIIASLNDPSAPPPGVNVSGCQLTAAHPRPVVLVNGTFSNMTDDWSGLGPVLANAGYCVYDAAIGGDPHSVIQTTGHVADSAQQIATLVSQVLSQTGASQVDLVGHSQGGLIAEYYTKILGGAPHVHTLVGLSPTTHGTTLDGLGVLANAFPGANQVLAAGCAACVDQESGSAIVNAVDSGPIAQPGVTYTIIETRYEYVVTPAGSAFIQEPGVTNQWVQDFCAFDFVDHASLPYDKPVQQLVQNALDPAHATAVQC